MAHPPRPPARGRIPFSAPPRLAAGEAAVLQALREGAIGCYGAPNRAAEERLGALLGRPTLLVSSGTHALEMSALLLALAPGDEVVVPSYAYVSTASAFARAGARIRFVDCDRFGNLDLDAVERALAAPRGRPRAVVPIHYGGACCDVERLAELCRTRGAALVEDAAHALGGSFAGRPLGAFGRLGCLSFDALKNVTAGQGGALVVGDAGLLEDAHRVRDRGTNRREFLAGRTREYTWTGIGSNYSLSDLNAALLVPQLDALAAITARRALLWRRYHDALAEPVTKAGAYVLEADPRARSSCHVFAVVWRDREQRDAFIRHMAADAIETPFHYTALHRSPFGRRFVSPGERFPGTERLADGLARLPLHDGLEAADQERVIERALAFAAGAR